MARKKKADGIIAGLPKNPDEALIVQKSRPLLALWQSSFELSHFKILDAYLARINSHKPEQRTVCFARGELEQLLGVTQLKKADLNARLRKLYDPVDMASGDSKKTNLIGLFERAEADQDEYGVWQINLTCTPSAMQYIFNIEKLGYFRYQLRSVTSLRSRYSYVLFMYLESHRDFHLEWVEDVDKLKTILRCQDDETYKEFRFFNSKILKKCHKELTEATACRFSYETIKRGKFVVGVKFKLEPFPVALDTPSTELEGQMGFDDVAYSEMDLYAPASDETDVILTAADKCEMHIESLMATCGGEFNREQIEAILTIIRPINRENPGALLDMDAEEEYLAQKYALFKVRASKGGIKKRFEYFLTMLENSRDKR